MLPSHINLTSGAGRSIQESCSCVSSSPVPAATSARPSSPNSSRPDTRSPAWPGRTPRPPPSRPWGPRCAAATSRDLDGLREAAADADAVVHLAFDHETMFAGDFAGATATDLAVVQAFGDALAGTGKTLIGIGFKPSGDAERDAVINANPRSVVARAIDGFTDRGVRGDPRRDPAGDPQRPRRARLHPDDDQVRPGRRRVRLRRRGRQPLARRPHPGRRLALPAGAGEGAGRSAVVRRHRRGHRSPRDRRGHRPPAGHPGGEHPARAGGGPLHGASRSSRWTSRCPTRTPGGSWAGSRPTPG